MRTLKTFLLALLVVASASCATEDATMTTLQEQAEETAADIATAIAESQEDMAEIGQRISESEASQDLQAAWQDLQAELTSLFTSLQSEGTVDSTQIQQVMDDFEQQLDTAGDEIAPEVRDAWDTLRAQIEQLIEQAG